MPFGPVQGEWRALYVCPHIRRTKTYILFLEPAFAQLMNAFFCLLPKKWLYECPCPLFLPGLETINRTVHVSLSRRSSALYARKNRHNPNLCVLLHFAVKSTRCSQDLYINLDLAISFFLHSRFPLAIIKDCDCVVCPLFLPDL